MKPVYALLLLLMLTAAQLGWYESRLPDPVVSSFDYDGEPQGWMSKGSALFYWTTISVLAAALCWGIAALIRRLGGRGINVPHPEYWLAPERKMETVGFVARRLEWFSVVFYLFMLWTHQLTIVANLSDPPHMPSGPFWLGFGAFMLFSTWWTLRLIMHFQFKPKDAS